MDDSSDRGTLKSNSLKVSYAHSIFVADGLAVSLGSSVGFIQKSIA